MNGGYDSHLLPDVPGHFCLQILPPAVPIKYISMSLVRFHPLRGEFGTFTKKEMPVRTQEAISFLHSAPVFIYCIDTG